MEETAAGNILSKQSRTDWKWWSSSLGLGVGLTTHRKNKLVTKIRKKPRTWTNSLDKRPKRKKMDVTLDTWNVRSMYRAGSLRTVAEEVSKYKLDLVRVQHVMWYRHGTEPAGEYTFFYNFACGSVWVYGLDRSGSG
jgi:hypothetical protein